MSNLIVQKSGKGTIGVLLAELKLRALLRKRSRVERSTDMTHSLQINTVHPYRELFRELDARETVYAGKAIELTLEEPTQLVINIGPMLLAEITDKLTKPNIVINGELLEIPYKEYQALYMVDWS